MKGILGKKVGMTQIYNEKGQVVPVTAILAGPCIVLQVKTVEKDGYNALKIALDSPKDKRKGKVKIKDKMYKFIKEIKTANTEEAKSGDKITVEAFQEGEFVDISGISKGKGFQGGMKKWNWKGGESSHGSMFHRRIGSIGASSYPSRVFKGHHMPGHMGNQQHTIQNLEIIKIFNEENILLVKGAVPGAKNTYLLIKRAKKKRAPQQANEKQETGKDGKKK